MPCRRHLWRTTPSNAAFARLASLPQRQPSCANIQMPVLTRFALASAGICAGAERMPVCCSQSRMRPAGKEELLNMAKVDWPPVEKRSLIGKRIDRADGPAKATGAAKYSYDINRPGMLWAKVLVSPHAHAKLVSIDVSAATASPKVKAAWRDENLIGQEVQYVGQIVAAVAAETEEAATEAIGKIKAEYEILPHQVVDSDLALFNDKPALREQGNVDDGFGKSDIVHSGEYGIPVITHCCLEPHGQVAEIRDEELYIWPSTQNV